MKLNISYKNKENILFSIEVQNHKNEESTIIVFAPNGVGKTSITKAISNYKVYKNVNSFFLSMDKDEKDLNVLVFKKENYKNHEIIWENIDNYNNTLLTKKLRKQIDLEREWDKCKMVLGSSIIPSGFLLHKNSYNYIYNRKNMRVIPNTINFHKVNEDLFNEHYLLISKESIESIKKLIHWHLTFIKDFENMGKQKQISLMYFLKIIETKHTYEKIKNIIESSLQFLRHLGGEPLSKPWGYDHKLHSIYKSWEFMLFIYNQYFSSIVPTFLYLDDIEKNIEMYKESLIVHQKELLKIENDSILLKKKFKYSNWMLYEEYNKDLEETKKKINDYLVKDKGSYCSFTIEHHRNPFSFVVKIKPKHSLSEGESKANILIVFLNLIFPTKKLDLLILDDPVTSLDYFHTSTIVTWLKGFKSSFLLLTHNFSFFSKFMSADMNRLSKEVYVMDKLNNEEVFSIKLEKSDSSFFLGKFVSFWEEKKLSVDEFIFTFDLVYELVKSFSIKKNECKSFLNRIDYYVRHSNKKWKKAKTIRTFVEESKDLLNHYKEIFLIDRFMKNYNDYLNRLDKSNSIIDIDLENYVINWDKESIDKYKEKIKNNTLSFSNYLTMKHLLIRCCNAKYKIIKNKKTNNKRTKAIYDQIKSLKHFESLRFIPLLEISCKTIIEYINYLNKNK